ncbi:MAG: hypothetical protein JWO25_2641, partial [Alphaproteobacteria bacterium]|nr:hypothetical protein [Alphaproteobacteria bacterium]
GAESWTLKRVQGDEWGGGCAEHRDRGAAEQGTERVEMAPAPAAAAQAIPAPNGIAFMKPRLSNISRKLTA